MIQYQEHSLTLLTCRVSNTATARAIPWAAPEERICLLTSKTQISKGILGLSLDLLYTSVDIASRKRRIWHTTAQKP
jgi:hypothetical protein